MADPSSTTLMTLESNSPQVTGSKLSTMESSKPIEEATPAAVPSTSATDSTSGEQQQQQQQQQNKVLLINGPNLNLLGTREPGIYGSTTLKQIETSLTQRAPKLNISLETFQSNYEGAIVERIHKAREDGVEGIIINPAAFTHYSVAIRDALLGTSIPYVELHISNVHAREEWRHKSFMADKAQAVICGLGVFGYVAALEWWSWNLAGGKQKGI